MEQHPRHEQPEEHGRRLYWEGAIILATGLAVVLLAFSLMRLPELSEASNLTSNAAFVLLINLNIILLILLVFLVARNLVKLFYERRRKLLGSHLRFRLVTAFVAISLFPAILLFFIGVGFMTRSLENWVTSQVEDTLEGALGVVNTFYAYLGDEALVHAHHVAAAITQSHGLAGEQRHRLQELVEEKRQVLHVGRVMVFSSDRTLLANATSAEWPAHERRGVDAALLERALDNEEVRQVRPLGKAEVVCSGVPIVVDGHVVGAVITEYFVPRSAAQQSAQVIHAFREYMHLRILKHPIRTNYVVTMTLVTLVAVFSAVWVGLFLAKKITVPLQRLAAGTREVAQGHWTHRIEGEAEDEIGTLVAAFNRMTGDLQQSHHELDARRRYMEIILTNITAGVMSLDRNGFVTTMNRAAERLLGLRAVEVIGKDYRSIFAASEFHEVRKIAHELLPESAAATGEGARESQGQLKLRRDGQPVSLFVTGTLLTDEHQEGIGVVYFFEDVTQIVRVERMEAWREVARRIAHEIKNPLTPIQLAAQRLQRRFAPQITHNADVFNECIGSIAHEVDAIKKLVNEFSSFARLPTADHAPENLNVLVQEVIPVFVEAHRDIDFVSEPDAGLPSLELDREGIKRVVRNLLDNAVAACRMAATGYRHHITVSTRYIWSLGMVQLEVADTGCGIPPEEKDRLFEPYFSTKKEGTGLGLAIVATIVADHQAFIRVRDNDPQGSLFIVELPVRRKAQRAPVTVDRVPLPLTGTGGHG
ncbi:MAG: HAMP domain-containing protein [Deltaproteobacteria bacterium]|nr:HAMP domain-containing protein [Deltaproteobacteria bacterium]